ncbi:PREDICTED: F-box protein At2g02240-like [Ipomoea nil]|uniref:F-box protein At2g02240-like n=1 Tax=Ipomoea nil TaxID=35883 RepID=UPI0009018580|nr:PREDICTED: F-box protein At2g02240-like [Ipomoea nil]
MEKLADNCISDIISFTSPVDASVFSVISKRFKTTSESDTVWNKLLPSDIQQILSRSSSSIPVFPTKKDLYLSLSDSPILLDGGKLSFWLEKKTGKKCFMVSAQELTFTGLHHTSGFMRVPEGVVSRFTEMASLHFNGGELELYGISGKVCRQMLSEETLYSCHLVMSPLSEDDVLPAVVVSRLFIDDESREVVRERVFPVVGFGNDRGRRSDGWSEVELGTFFNVGRNILPSVPAELQMSFSIAQFPPHFGLGTIIVQGIEFRTYDCRAPMNIVNFKRT